MIAGPGSPSVSIRLVVFDLGRVLVRICDDWKQACSCAGLELPDVPLDPGGLNRLRDIVHRAEVGELGTAGFSEAAAPVLGLSPAQVRAMSEAFIFGAYAGAADLLKELSAGGVRTACLSNTNEHHWGLLSEQGHRAYFPLDRLNHRFASHLIRARKPDMKIYEHVEREAGVPGDSMLFFDDVPENIQAARARGWNAKWIDPSLNDPIGQIRKTLASFGVLAV